MQYFILGAVALVAVFLILWSRRYYYRHTFDKYLDMQVSVLLAKERTGTRRVHGSLILELKQYDNTLESIYITTVRSKNEKIRIKYFIGLLFKVNNKDRRDTTMLSIGVQMPRCAERSCKKNKEHIYVGGKLVFTNNRKKYFGKDILLHAIR